jgi:hypothetical protein
MGGGRLLGRGRGIRPGRARGSRLIVGCRCQRACRITPALPETTPIRQAPRARRRRHRGRCGHRRRCVDRRRCQRLRLSPRRTAQLDTDLVTSRGYERALHRRCRRGRHERCAATDDRSGQGASRPGSRSAWIACSPRGLAGRCTARTPRQRIGDDRRHDAQRQARPGQHPTTHHRQISHAQSSDEFPKPRRPYGNRLTNRRRDFVERITTGR